MIGLGAKGAERGVRLADDPARLELLPVEAVRAEAAAAGLRAHLAPPEKKAARFLVHARALREHGRRAGAPESLAKAARAAETSLEHARTPSAAFEARLERLRATLDAAELSGDGALLDAARARLSDLAEAAPPTPEAAARLQAAHAAVRARLALETGSAERAVEAGETADAAVCALSRLPAAVETAETRIVRADLMTGFALRLRDGALAARACADMQALSAALDPDRTPVLAARAVARHGAALTVQGELTGETALLVEAAEALARAFHDLPPRHSPAERAALGRALGHAARALAQASGDDASLYEAAERAFAAALTEVSGWGPLPLPATLAFERAMLLAHRGTIGASRLARGAAETALKAELIRLDAQRQPAAWAAAQVALARLYAEHRRPEATMALTAAVEVFREAGLKSLAEAAAEDLAQLAEAAA